MRFVSKMSSKIFLILFLFNSSLALVCRIKISNVNLNLDTNRFLTLNWDVNQLCDQTKIVIDIERIGCDLEECSMTIPNIQVMQKSYQFMEPLAPCSKFHLRLHESSSGNIIHHEEFRTENQKINLSVKQFDENIHLSWNYKEHPSCPMIFAIKVQTKDGDIRKITSLKNKTEIVIEGLEPCENYVFSVHPENSDPVTYGDSIDYLMKISSDVQVRNLSARYVETEEAILINWQPPESRVTKCYSMYSIEVSSDDGKDRRTISTNSLNEMIASVYACTTYEIKVVPLNLDNQPLNSPIKIEIRVPDRRFEKPQRPRIEYLTAYSVRLKVELNSKDERNFCEVEHVFYECTSSEGKLEEFGNLNQEIGLKPDTKYTCSAKVKGKLEYSQKSDSLTFKTSSGSKFNSILSSMSF